MTYVVVWMALGMALGAGLASAFCIGPQWLWIGAAVCVLASACLRWAPRAVRVGLLLAVVGLLGWLRAGSDSGFPEWLLRRAPGLTELTGTVLDAPDLDVDSMSFTLSPRDLPGDVIVYWDAPEPAGRIHLGDTVRATGSAQLPQPFDGFDYPAYLAQRGVFASFFADEVEVIGEVRPGLWRWGDRLRQRIIARLRETLSQPVAAMAQSLIFGDRSALDPDTEEAFSRTGLMHLLAVSGLHLGIFLAGAWWGLRRLGLRPRATYPIVGALVLLALTVVGPRVSLVRAGLLFAFLGLGSVLADCGLILRRWIHPLNGLALAAIVILTMRPGALYEAGFQLTMAATASILIAFSPRGWGTRLIAGWEKRATKRPLLWIVRLLVVSMAAQAGAAPVIAWHFQSFHPLAILVNLAAVPLAGVSLWAGLLALPWTAMALFAHAVVPLALLLRVLRGLVLWVSNVPGMALTVTPAFGVWMAGCVLFLVLADYVVASSSRTSNSISMASDSDEGR